MLGKVILLFSLAYCVKYNTRPDKGGNAMSHSVFFPPLLWGRTQSNRNAAAIPRNIPL